MNLADIPTMDRATLESLWQKHMPKVPMPSLNLRTLRGALAYEWQIKETGGLSKRSAQILRGYLPKPADKKTLPGSTAAKEGESVIKTAASASAATPIITPGSLLVREWSGRR